MPSKGVKASPVKIFLFFLTNGNLIHFKKLQSMKHYRPNVAVLLLKPNGKILVCERLRVKGAWQFPQGGVDQGETLEEALKREVQEEVGIAPDAYRIEEMRGGYRYLYPAEIFNKRKTKKDPSSGEYKVFDGQEQTYFRCVLHSEEVELDLDGKPKEFRSAQWINPEEFRLDWLPPFKRKVYSKVLQDFFNVEIA